MSQNNQSGSGIGFTGLLFLVFLVLKLTHVIDWSWWYVTMPLWAGLVIAIAAFLVYIGVVVVKEKKRQPVKSKWQERLEQMQASQQRIKDLKNK